MKVKELADALGTSAHTIRFYTQIGILKPGRNRGNGYKEYGDKENDRLRFVLCARQLGFSVKDIQKIVREADSGNSPCPMTREIIESRLQETESRNKDAIALRKRMKKAVKEWELKPDRLPTGNIVCHLIEEFTSK